MAGIYETPGDKKPKGELRRRLVHELCSRLHQLLDDFEVEWSSEKPALDPKTPEDMEKMLAEAYRKKANCKYAPWESNVDGFLDGLEEAIENYGEERIKRAVVHYCTNTILNRKDHQELVVSSVKSLVATLTWIENDIRYKALS